MLKARLFQFFGKRTVKIFLKFMEIEDNDIIIEHLKESIHKTRVIKSDAFEKADQELIGINLFKNNKEQAH